MEIVKGLQLATLRSRELLLLLQVLITLLCLGVTASDDFVNCSPNQKIFNFSDAPLFPEISPSCSSLTSLQFSICPEVSVPDNLFESATNLRYLSLHVADPSECGYDNDNGIVPNSFPYSFLHPLSFLRELEIPVQFLPCHSLDNQEHLTKLVNADLYALNGSVILYHGPQLCSYLFNNLKALESLVLTNVLFSGSNPNAFEYNQKLVEINLRNAALSSLPSGIFHHNTLLKTIDLSHNSLSTLHADIFDPLCHLTSLDLSSNVLTALPPGIFDSQDGFISKLDLSNNSFQGCFCEASYFNLPYIDAPLCDPECVDTPSPSYHHHNYYYEGDYWSHNSKVQCLRPPSPPPSPPAPPSSPPPPPPHWQWQQHQDNNHYREEQRKRKERDRARNTIIILVSVVASVLFTSTALVIAFRRYKWSLIGFSKLDQEGGSLTGAGASSSHEPTSPPPRIEMRVFKALYSKKALKKEAASSSSV